MGWTDADHAGAARRYQRLMRVRNHRNLRKLASVEGDLRVYARRRSTGQAWQARLRVFVEIQQETDFSGRGSGARGVRDERIVGVGIDSNRVGQRRWYECRGNQTCQGNRQWVGDAGRANRTGQRKHDDTLILITDNRDGMVRLIDREA